MNTTFFQFSFLPSSFQKERIESQPAQENVQVKEEEAVVHEENDWGLYFIFYSVYIYQCTSANLEVQPVQLNH